MLNTFPPLNQTEREFATEIGQRIEQLFSAIDDLRTGMVEDSGKRELLDRVFRHTHSIKGSASAIGLTRLAEIAHEFENLLVAVRSDPTSLDEAIVDQFEDNAQLLFEQLTFAERQLLEPGADELVSVRAATRQLGTVLGSLPVEVDQALSSEERESLALALDAGSGLYLVTAKFELQDLEQRYSSLRQELDKHGNIMSRLPTVDPEHPGKINFRIVYVSRAALSALGKKLEPFASVSISCVSAPAEAQEIEKAGSEPPSNLIQVKLNDLDRLAAAVHDLFAATTKALEHLEDINLGGKTGKEEVLSIRQAFLALGEKIIDLRLVPVGRMLQRVVRAGRIAARASGKTVDFEVLGADVLLDKFLVNVLTDPLIQLVRNAVDHGIENPEERQRLAKNARGQIRIEVLDEGGLAVVTVSDDGGGVNPEVIAKAATSLGLIAPDSTIDLDKSVRLIFLSGFSSAPAVSGVSGRGVGLDVVETAIEQAGGEMLISSEVGKGTVFEIRLPISFGLLDSTVVISDSNYYCLESQAVVQWRELPPNRLEVDAGTLFTKFEGENLPVFRLRSLLRQPAKHQQTLLPLLVCQLKPRATQGNQRIPRRLGLIVDQIEGPERILMRGLGSHGGRWRGIAGATELRNGVVGLVIDLPRLLQSLSAAA